MLWWNLAALAAPTVIVNEDHSVVGTVALAVSSAEVRKEMNDPRWLAGVDSSGTTVTVIRNEGDCVVTENVTPSVFKTVRYTVKQCPTTDGFDVTLIESNTFDRYHCSWTFSDKDGSAQVRYQFSADVNLMVPQFILDRNTAKGIRNMLASLEAHYER